MPAIFQKEFRCAELHFDAAVFVEFFVVDEFVVQFNAVGGVFHAVGTLEAEVAFESVVEWVDSVIYHILNHQFGVYP